MRMKRLGWIGVSAAATLAVLAVAPAVFAQGTPDEPGTENMKLIGQHHAGDGLEISYTDVEVEQEPGRPYAYLARVLGPTLGMDIVSIEDPANPELLYQWRIEDPELHIGLGGMDTKYFKHDGRYYVIQSYQFFGGPDTDLGAVVLDVTGLPDASTVKEVGRIRAPDTPDRIPQHLGLQALVGDAAPRGHHERAARQPVRPVGLPERGRGLRLHRAGAVALDGHGLAVRLDGGIPRLLRGVGPDR